MEYSSSLVVQDFVHQQYYSFFQVFPVGEFFKSPDLAGHLWWQPHDFVNFLRTRLDIAEAYKAAAQSLGVDALSYLTDGKYKLKGWNSNEDEWRWLMKKNENSNNLIA